MNPPPCLRYLAFASILLAGPTALADSPPEPTTEAQGERQELERYQVSSDEGIVAADEAQASQIGAQILAAGGNAADAGVAALVALNITHPFASGLGGGGFCLYHEADDDRTHVIDYRETAPKAAHRDLYIVDGEAQHDLARHGGLAVATPGEPAGLWSLHGRFGHLDWEALIDPSIELARSGATVSDTLAEHLDSRGEALEERPPLAALFQDDDGQWLQGGDLMVRDDLARALTLLRDDGVRPFYVGPIADAIVDAVSDDGGILTTDDLANYAVERRDPIVGHFADHRIVSMPPPSSGGIALIQAFQILERLMGDDLPVDVHAPDFRHLAIEALKHAFADRARYLGDTDFVDVPVDHLMSPDYARQLADRVQADATLDTDDYGTVAPDQETSGTAHLSVIDADDNLLACTSTINTRFGSMVLVEEYGLIMNNEMADFTIKPGEPNVFGLVGNEQNAVEALKRPLSSMSPTLVFDDQDRPVATLGASGGPTIISGTYFTLIDTLLGGLDPLGAIAADRFHHQWLPPTLFAEHEDMEALDTLRDFGHDIEVRPSFTAVQIIMRGDAGWIGVSDPRKGGIPAAPDDDSSDH